MPNHPAPPNKSNNKKQELLMRDALKGLEEISTMLNYDPWPGDFEIIAIYPPENEADYESQKTVIMASTTRPTARVLSFEEYRDRLKLSA